MTLTYPRKREGINVTVLPDGRWLLYHPATNFAIALNAPAGILWELCDGKSSLEQISAEISGYYPDVQPTLLQEEIRQMLTTLYDQGLMSPHEQS